MSVTATVTEYIRWFDQVGVEDVGVGADLGAGGRGGQREEKRTKESLAVHRCDLWRRGAGGREPAAATVEIESQ